MTFSTYVCNLRVKKNLINLCRIDKEIDKTSDRFLRQWKTFFIGLGIYLNLPITVEENFKISGARFSNN